MQTTLSVVTPRYQRNSFIQVPSRCHEFFETFSFNWGNSCWFIEMRLKSRATLGCATKDDGFMSLRWWDVIGTRKNWDVRKSFRLAHLEWVGLMHKCCSSSSRGGRRSPSRNKRNINQHRMSRSFLFHHSSWMESDVKWYLLSHPFMTNRITDDAAASTREVFFFRSPTRCHNNKSRKATN